MDEVKLSKLREELKRARKKQEDWADRVKDLERRYNEAEKTCVYEIVKTLDVKPEELAGLLKSLKTGLPVLTVYEEKDEEGNNNGTVFEKEGLEEWEKED